MSDDVVITFDSPADVWRVQRGTVTVEIQLQEMTDEYYRWVHEGRPGGDWREHAEVFCLKRLEDTIVANPANEASDGNNPL